MSDHEMAERDLARRLIDRIESRMDRGWRSVKFEGAELDVVKNALRAYSGEKERVRTKWVTI